MLPEIDLPRAHPVARLRGEAVAYLELEAYGSENGAAAARAADVLDVGEWSAAATPPLELAADVLWADDEPKPGDRIATMLPTYALTCPKARAFTERRLCG